MPRIQGDSWTQEDYKKFLFNLLKNTSTLEAHRRVSIASAYEYYYGKSENRGYNNLLTLHETEITSGMSPFVKLNFDSISPKLKLLMGELRMRGFEPSIRATNKESTARKRAFERQLRFQARMQQTYQRAAEFTGVPYGVNEQVPANDEAIDAYMETYQDYYEKIMEKAIRDCVDANMYIYRRRNTFLDLLVSNECHYALEWDGPYPYLRRINPLHCIHDMLSEDDFREDSTYFVEARYISIPDAIMEYDIPEAQMKELTESYKKQGLGWNGTTQQVNSTHITLFQPFIARGAGWGNSDFSHILVYSAKWKDTEDITQKTTFDKYGNEHTHSYMGYDKRARLTGKEKQDERNKLDKKKTQIVRKATLVGGDILTDYGHDTNQLRSYQKRHKVVLPYTSLVKDYNNYDSVSLVNRLSALQDFQDYVLTKMQVSITTAIDGAVMVDISKIPDFYADGDQNGAAQDFLQTLKTYRVAFYDSSKDALAYNPGGINGTPIEAIDVKTRNTIIESIQLAQFIQAQMDQISGINEARMGAVQPRQLSSTTQIGIAQSNAITEADFEVFEAFEKIAFKKLAMSYAMSFDNNPAIVEEYAIEVGEYQAPEDFSFQDFDAKIKVNPISRQQLLTMVEMAVAQGNLSTADALRVITDSQDNLRKAIERFIDITEKREAMMMQMRQQEAEAQRQSALAQQQQQVQGQLANTQLKGQYDVEKSKVISDSDYQAKLRELQQKDRSTAIKAQTEKEKAIIGG